MTAVISARSTELDSSSWRLVAKRFGVDVFAATVTAFALSPFVTTIDKSVASWRSGRAPNIMSTVRTGVRELLTRTLLGASSSAHHPVRIIQ